MTRRKKLFAVVGVLVGVLILAGFIMSSGRTETLAMAESPAGTWKVTIKGRQTMRGVEVTMAARTSDGITRSFGVIDLCDSFDYAKYKYAESVTQRLQVDETKALFGDRLVLLGDIDKSKQAVVEGHMNEIPVSLTHGEWRNTGLVLHNGRIEARRDRLHVMLTTEDGVFGNGWSVTIGPHGTQSSGEVMVGYDYRDPETDVGMGGYLGRGFTLELKVDSVSRHLITGSIDVNSADPPVQLSGPFRVVNARP